VEVRHIPVSRDDVPKKLMDLLEAGTVSYVWFYRTDVTNTTDRPIRIIWFEGFITYNGAWVSSNIKNRVLRTTEFLQWFGGDVTADGWLRPGGTATCHVNWHYSGSSIDVTMIAKWAFIAVDAEGNDYFAEAIVPNMEPVKLR